jgi:ParB family transcriptional regulator, chromosome partitioning protein
MEIKKPIDVHKAAQPDPERKASGQSLPVESISANPLQPRRTFNVHAVSSLAESIRANGILQPIVVRERDGRYEIIAGERRWRAAQEAGLKNVPVVFRDATDEQMLELALIENIQREDLNAIERAKAYRQFCDEFGVKADDVAHRMGEDRSTVANYLRLLDLDLPIQDMVADGEISMGHARCLLGIPERSRRERLAQMAVKENLSVRALEQIVRNEKGKEGGGAGASPKRRSAHIEDMEQRFERQTKTKVAIHEGHKKGTGRIVIEYYSLDDFDRIAELFGVKVD